MSRRCSGDRRRQAPRTFFQFLSLFIRFFSCSVRYSCNILFFFLQLQKTHFLVPRTAHGSGVKGRPESCDLYGDLLEARARQGASLDWCLVGYQYSV